MTKVSDHILEMDVATKSIPQPLAGETAEQYCRRLVDAGFVAEDSSSNAEKQSPQPAFLDRSRLQLLQDQLIAAVPETAAIGNKSLREKLANIDPAWATDTYWDVKQRCIDDGLLRPGRGRGGSVLRATPREQPEVEASSLFPGQERPKPAKARQSAQPATIPKTPLSPAVAPKTAQEAIRVAFEIGVKAFNEGDFATTLREWGNLAEQGIPVAQYNIGLMHYSGRGAEKNVEKALSWIAKAAANGHARAQLKAGLMLEAGIEAVQDLAAAAKWYQKAAENGNAEAQYRLARMFSSGRGVDEDGKQALGWFRKSGEQGHIAAAYELAMCYGRHPWEDQKEHVKWARKAAEQGHAGAQYRLYCGCARGADGFEKNGEEALKWLRLAAENGDCGAQYLLGSAYVYGEDELFVLQQDSMEAARWLRLAANRGDLNALESLESLYADELLPGKAAKATQVLLDAADDGDCVAQYLLAGRLMTGDGVGKDIAEAAKWFEASAEQGHPWAQLQLGHLYAEGQGVNQTYDAAYHWYMAAYEQKKPEGVAGDVQGNVQTAAAQSLMELNQKLGKTGSSELEESAKGYSRVTFTDDLECMAEDGDVSAQVELADQYRLGEEREVDLAQAAYWYRQAAVQGDSHALNCLGSAYLCGEGVPQNMIAGQALFELAAAAGDEHAAQNLIDSLGGGGKAHGVEKLAKQMSKPGKFLEALDKFVDYRESRRKPRKPKG